MSNLPPPPPSGQWPSGQSPSGQSPSGQPQEYPPAPQYGQQPSHHGQQYGYGAPPPPPVAATGKTKMRGRIPLRLALIFGVIGLALCVVGVVVLVRSPLSRVDDFPRVALDGSPHAVQLTRTGEYIGFYEAPGLSPSDSPPAGNLRIVGPSGEVPFVSYRNRQSYEISGRTGVAVLKFTVDRPGRYLVGGTSEGPDGADLALGESIVKSLAVGLLLFFPGLLLVIAAIVLLIVGLVKRSRHKRELASAYAGHPGPNYYTGQ